MCSNNTNPNNSSDLLAVLASGRPNSAEKPTTVSEKDSTHRELWGKLRSKGQNIWILFRGKNTYKRDKHKRDSILSCCKKLDAFHTYE
jgi:hypothetical protein